MSDLIERLESWTGDPSRYIEEIDGLLTEAAARIKELEADRDAIEAATIERCAEVVSNYKDAVEAEIIDCLIDDIRGLRPRSA